MSDMTLYNELRNTDIVMENFYDMMIAQEGRNRIRYIDVVTEAFANPTKQAGLLNKLYPEVFEALKRVDNNIVKLDTVNVDYILCVDRPVGRYDLPTLLECMRAFKGQCVIQTMFMKGVDAEGVSVDNTTPEYVLPWLDAVERIAPREVMIYTIDRETPAHGLLKATSEELNHIVVQLQSRGLKASASY